MKSFIVDSRRTHKIMSAVFSAQVHTVVRHARYAFAGREDGSGDVMIHVNQCRIVIDGTLSSKHDNYYPDEGKWIILTIDENSPPGRPRALAWGYVEPSASRPKIVTIAPRPKPLPAPVMVQAPPPPPKVSIPLDELEMLALSVGGQNRGTHHRLFPPPRRRAA